MHDTSETASSNEATERLGDDGLPPATHPDARRSHLRTLLARIDRTVPAITLNVAWNELVDTLNLGPEPETRACSKCHALVMRNATRCGHCWTHLGD